VLVCVCVCACACACACVCAKLYLAVLNESGSEGYGDIPARTWKERTVAVIVMWLGCAFFAWIMGRITHLLTKESICVISFENTMQEMIEWMEARALSVRLVARIQPAQSGYFSYCF
jgi:hypothetical protein